MRSADFYKLHKEKRSQVRERKEWDKGWPEVTEQKCLCLVEMDGGVWAPMHKQ